MATRVTDAEKDRMRELRGEGWSYVAIGVEIGRSETAVACVCDPEQYTRVKVYQQTPEYKASKKIYRQTPEYKDAARVYA